MAKIRVKTLLAAILALGSLALSAAGASAQDTTEVNRLNEIVIKPDYRYVRWMLSNIEKNKPKNNPEEFDRYIGKVYTKMELGIANAEQNVKNKMLRRKFGFVFAYMDTSQVSGQPYLPIMISESTSSIYHQKELAINKEVIEASRISGVQEEITFAQFTGAIPTKVNLYDDYIKIFNIQIPSPISQANIFYNYFIIDSLSVEGRKTYHIRFHPSNLISTPALDGEMRVDSTDWAVRQIRARLKKDSNVNWIKDLVLESDYHLVPSTDTDSVWFYKNERLYADFSVTMRDSSNMLSFLARRQTDYSEPSFDTAIPEDVTKMSSKVKVIGNSYTTDEEYWKSARPFQLSERESNIYKMVDSVKSVPAYHNIYSMINTFINGYYDFKYFGIGPYLKLFSFNNLEGARFQFGVRTTENFHRKLRLGGHIAYGTKDKEFKGGATIEYLFQKEPTRKLAASASRDVVQLGMSKTALTEDNLISSLLTKGGGSKLSMVNDFSVGYLHEWSNNFNNSIAIEHRRIFSNRYVPMFTPDSSLLKSVAANQIHYTARFSWQESVTRGAFDKYYLHTNYPIITIDLIGAVKGLSNNDYGFFRTEGTIDYTLPLPPLGESRFRLNGGKIWGKVPYPLLKIHEGNGTYFFDPNAFACMDFYEFASDSWATLFYQHNFKGVVLGKLPLIKRLQLRELFTFKAGYGTLSKGNSGILLFPTGMSSLTKPYMEIGVGLSNIFRVIRVDYFWRLTHRHKTIDGVRQKAKHRSALNIGIEWSF